MEQRDLLKDQIKQLGKALAKVLSDLLGLKSKGQLSQGIEIISQRLKEEYDIDIHEIKRLNQKDLTAYLKERQLTSDHLEILSAYFKEIGIAEMQRHPQEAKIRLEKAIELLIIADELTKTLSFNRLDQRANLEEQLKKISN